MRALAQPKNLGRALVAALLTSLACYPRLATWAERSAPVSLLWVVLLWTMFVLWAFVFAWHFQYARRPVLGLGEFQPRLWTIATGGALVAAVFAHLVMDPHIRPLAPALYPTDWGSWLAMGLWTLAFAPLFLCFAPFAFFIRLSRRQEAALALTVGFEVFVLALKISSTPGPFSLGLLAGLMAVCAASGFASLYLYLKGGALLVWWVLFLLELRFLLDIRAGG